MKKMIILLIIASFPIFSQTYREMHTTQIILNENQDNNNNLYIIKTPVLTQSITFTIPVGQGQVGDILTSNGVNSTTWSELESGQVAGAGDGLIQYKNSSFDASANLVWDNINNRLGVGIPNPDYSLHTSGTINIGSIGTPAVLAIGSPNSSGKYLYIKTDATSNSSVFFTLPPDNGNANQGLISNSSGSLSWGGEINKGPVSNNEPNDNDMVGYVDNAYMGGGTGNDITNSAHNSSIYGGTDNNITNAAHSTGFFGGSSNNITNTAHYSVLLGGSNNTIGNAIHSMAMVGGYNNTITNTAHYSFIGAGSYNEINNSANSMVIMSGRYNEITNSARNFFIGAGGGSNSSDGNYTSQSSNNSGILTGKANYASNSAQRWAIMSGDNCRINSGGGDQFIGGGKDNTVMGNYCFVLGGNDNQMTSSPTASGTLWGNGCDFAAGSEYSHIGGDNARITGWGDDHILFGRALTIGWPTGCFLFGDANNNSLTVSSNYQFRTRFSNGYRLWTNSAANVGVKMDADDNAWASVSDRNLKESIVSLNPLNFLNKIKELDIFSWSYKGFEDKGIRNYGPMAQDFFALFGEDEYGVYGNDTSIKELDAAAIFVLGVQGSSIKIENQKNELSKTEDNSNYINSKLAELEKRLNEIESKK